MPIALKKKKIKYEVIDNDALETIIRTCCDCDDNCLLGLCKELNNYSRGIKIMTQARAELAHHHLLLQIVQLLTQQTSL